MSKQTIIAEPGDQVCFIAPIRFIGDWDDYPESDSGFDYSLAIVKCTILDYITDPVNTHILKGYRVKVDKYIYIAFGKIDVEIPDITDGALPIGCEFCQNLDEAKLYLHKLLVTTIDELHMEIGNDQG